MKRSLVLSLCLAAAACGGSSGSGVGGEKKLVELSTSERDQVCAYVVEVTGGARTVTCSDGSEVTIQSAAECAASYGLLGASCAATVDDAEGCAEATGDDPCTLSLSACGALFQCLASA